MRRYEGLAFRCAFLIVRDADEANDVAQDAFLRAFDGLARFQAGKEFRPWLLTIVGNQARNHRRGRTRRAAATLRAAQGAAAPEGAPADEALLAAERRAELLAAIERLRPDDREVITLRWFAELNEAEMAAALGCARGTVKSRLARAMTRLRAIAVGSALGDRDV